MLHIRQNVLQMPVDHPRHLDDRLQARMRRPEVPVLPMPQRPAPATVLPQITQRFLDRPSPARLQVQYAKSGELLRFLVRMRILCVFDERQLVYTTAIAVIFAVLIVITLIRRRWAWTDRDAFVLLWLAIVGLYILSGSAVADVKDRLREADISRWVEATLVLAADRCSDGPTEAG